MHSDNDEILDELHKDLVGTPAHDLSTNEFLKMIKKACPETIFHGTDVGHQYDTTGAKFLKYLEDNNMDNSEQYLLATEAIWQGKYYYTDSKDRVNRDNIYRENKMAENFIREFEKLNGQSVMGIYGASHTYLNAMDPLTNTVPCMGNQLKQHYGEIVISKDLSWIEKDIDPISINDTITLNGKIYTASYFGEVNITGVKDFAFRKFWRLENAYDDFKSMSKTHEVLPYNNYPVLIKTGQVFVIEYTKINRTVTTVHYRSDGNFRDNLPTTEAFILE